MYTYREISTHIHTYIHAHTHILLGGAGGPCPAAEQPVPMADAAPPVRASVDRVL